MDLLPETSLNKIHRDKHNLENTNSMNHVNMFKQHYDDIPSYTKQVYEFQQIRMNIQIRNMLMPLQRNLGEIDTSNTTQFDGECNCLYRGEKCLKTNEADMNVKIKIDSFNFAYGVNLGRRLSFKLNG